MTASMATITADAVKQKGKLMAANSATCRGQRGPPRGNLRSRRNTRGVSTAQGKYQEVQANKMESHSRLNPVYPTRDRDRATVNAPITVQMRKSDPTPGYRMP